MTPCQDSGPARNHWFCTRAEMLVMLKDRRFRPAGFSGVCDPSIKTYQMRDGVRVDATSYRFYPR